ncbi:type II toxin-antitoxin system Phd/YefM family antitoxin [Georgenia sunbinii]|uniref:type II toxin-antitoxin system Phd/YefM family antitoxin n=1 Tax=Georgenia sunbinii TaxID=3117728 RepID=UPI002F260AE0
MCPSARERRPVEIGLRELRQDASEVVRRAESGSQFVVTVAGRAAASLGPVAPRSWCTPAELDAIFAAPAWGTGVEARDYLEQSVRDPWQEAE